MKPLKNTTSIIALLLSLPFCIAADAHEMEHVSAMKKARDILAKLTLEEKISLCHGNSTMTINAIPRVGIKKEFTMSDGPHNVRPDLKRNSFGQTNSNQDYSTSLPSLSALAATWDPELAKAFGHVLGQESRDRKKDMLLGPGVNIQRTPLCGRNWEYMGEDPFLASSMVVPYIRAVQANDVAACVKHYALNNQEWNRTRVNVEVDERTLREIYLPAYRAAVVDGGVLTVMNGFNKFRGEYCSHSDYLNNQILKKEWGFKGFVVTDWGGVHDTIKGALGGLDVEMNAGRNVRYFKKPLLDAVRAGTVPMSVIDDKVLRVLYVMAKTTLLDDKERVNGSRNTPAHAAVARQVAESAIVLLKNEENLLPMDATSTKKLLVIGRNATTKHCRDGGSAEGKPLYEVTPLDGLKKLLGKDVKIEAMRLPKSTATLVVNHIPDHCIKTVDTTVMDAGLTIKAWKAEYFDNKETAGTPVYSGYDRQIDFNWKNKSPRKGMPSDQFACRWTTEIIAPESGEYVFSVKMDDRARVTINGTQIIDGRSKSSKQEQVTGVFTMTAGENYTIVVEYFESAGRAGITFGWQLPSEKGGETAYVRKRAADADAVLLFTGTTHGRGRAMEREGGDLPDMELQKGEAEAVTDLLGINPNTIVINLSGTPLNLTFADQAHTLVQYWYAGQEGGHALASVLFGNVNPSGKLPFSWPRKLKDSPAHAMDNYNSKSVIYGEGIFVGYRWHDEKEIQPLFPFGYGLSYTSFEIGTPTLSAPSIKPGDQLTVTVNVTNTGKRAGAEVVQLYIADVEASVPRPPKELKGFKKVFLKPAESKQVSFKLTTRDLSFWDVTTKSWKAEPGDFDVLMGASSRNISSKARFHLIP